MKRCQKLLYVPIIVLPHLSALAAVEVEINGLSDELLLNVEAHLHLKKRGQEEEFSEPAIRRLYAGADKAISRALRPFGYYDPQIDSQLLVVDTGWLARFEIDPGHQVILENVDVRIDGEGRTDPDFAAILDAPGLRAGEPLYHPSYDRLKSKLAQVAADNGYLDARFTQHELTVDPARHRASVRLHLDTGPRYRLGPIRIVQDFLKQRTVTRVINLREGEYFDGNRLRETEYALYATGYFAVVEIESTPNDETLEVLLTFTMTRGGRHRWTAGGGFSTDTKLYLKGGWYNPLANRRGHRMGLDLRVSEVKQDLLYRYVIPSGTPTENLSLLAGLISEERGDTQSNRIDVAAIDSRFWGNWQRDFVATARAERSEVSAFDIDDFWLIPGMRLIRSNWDVVTRPTRGYKAVSEIRGSASPLGSPTEYLQIQVRSALYVPVNETLRFYLRGELGATLAEDFNSLPASQRFFAGGDRSVRGFGLNVLSPVNELGDRVGGKHLLFVSAELEYDLLERWTIAAFADAGNAFDSFGDALEYSLGVGLRWRSPVGLIGADIAQALSVDGVGPRLHFSVRPEL